MANCKLDDNVTTVYACLTDTEPFYTSTSVTLFNGFKATLNEGCWVTKKVDGTSWEEEGGISPRTGCLNL